MFTFHHVNAFQVPAGSSNCKSNGSSSSHELLVLDTVGWDQISFESSQHNLSTEYYKGESYTLGCNTMCTAHWSDQSRHSGVLLAICWLVQAGPNGGLSFAGCSCCAGLFTAW
jgi:hypothetical protein